MKEVEGLVCDQNPEASDASLVEKKDEADAGNSDASKCIPIVEVDMGHTVQVVEALDDDHDHDHDRDHDLQSTVRSVRNTHWARKRDNLGIEDHLEDRTVVEASKGDFAWYGRPRNQHRTQVLMTCA
jgi:hypothetical protein